MEFQGVLTKSHSVFTDMFIMLRSSNRVLTVSNKHRT